jgi:hypothetical protein
MIDDPLDELQGRADRLIAELLGELAPEQATYAAAVLLNRAANELHRQARAGAAARQGTESWGTWAGLRNVARNLVLQSSTARDAAAALVGRRR